MSNTKPETTKGSVVEADRCELDCPYDLPEGHLISEHPRLSSVVEAPERIWISPGNAKLYARPIQHRDPIDTVEYARVHQPDVQAADVEPSEANLEVAREIVDKIARAAIELAFVRHELTTTEYEDSEYADVEEGVEAFKELVEGVKADVIAVLTGDDTGCLDPEDVDYDNETEWTRKRIAAALAASPVQADPIGVRCQSCGGRAGLDFHDEKCPYVEADNKPTPVRTPPLVRCIKCTHRGFRGVFLKCPTCGCECVWPRESIAVQAADAEAARKAAEEIAREIINPILSSKQRPLRDFEIEEITAIISRYSQADEVSRALEELREITPLKCEVAYLTDTNTVRVTVWANSIIPAHLFNTYAATPSEGVARVREWKDQQP